MHRIFQMADLIYRLTPKHSMKSASTNSTAAERDYTTVTEMGGTSLAHVTTWKPSWLQLVCWNEPVRRFIFC